MVSQRLREIETEVDNHFRSNPLLRKTFGTSALHLLTVCEERQLKSLLSEGPGNDFELEALADNVINSCKPAMKWLLDACEMKANDQPKYDDAAFGNAVELADLAHSYLTFQSAFTYASLDLADLTLDGQSIRTSGIMRSGAVYDAYDRIANHSARTLSPLVDLEFMRLLVATLRPVGLSSFSYSFSPQLISQALEAFKSNLDQRFHLPIAWDFPLFDLDQFGKVARVIWIMTFLHLQARLIAVRKGCGNYCVENAILRMDRASLIARVSRYSRVDQGATEAIISYLTYGEHGQTNPDPALQPLIALDRNTIALAPSIIVNCSLERNLMVLINRVPDAQRAYSKLNAEKEILMRRALLSQIEGKGFVSWNGNIRAWGTAGEVDLVLVSHEERTCLVLELKSFLDPAEPMEVINRSTEITKGINQIQRRKQAHFRGPDALFATLDINTQYSVHWAVVSENSIGANYVHVQDIPVIRRSHLGHSLASQGSLASTCEWLNEGMHLPIEGIDFEEVEMQETIGDWTVDWYGVRLLSK